MNYKTGYESSPSIALEFAPNMFDSYKDIPDYQNKIIALIREWVSTEKKYSIHGYENAYGAPPQGKHDTASMHYAKRELFELMQDNSQSKIEQYKDDFIDRASETRNVYVMWFYTEKRMKETLAYFKLMTTQYSNTTALNVEIQLLIDQIEPAKKRRGGDAWINEIDTFINYWSRP